MEPLLLIVVGVLILWVSALIRFIVLLLAGRGWESFAYRPVLNLVWLGSAVVSFLVALLVPAVCRPPRGDAKIWQAKADLKNLENACRAYSMEYGVYPTGSTVQVVQILTSNNARRIVFFETPSRRHAISKQGEFVDPWGKPYKFSIVEGQLPVVLSAGPNHLFGDKDDLSTTN